MGGVASDWETGRDGDIAQTAAAARLDGGRCGSGVAPGRPFLRHAHSRGDGRDDVRCEASMTAKRDQARYATGVCPAVDGLRRDTEDASRFSRRKVRRIVRMVSHRAPRWSRRKTYTHIRCGNSARIRQSRQDLHSGRPRLGPAGGAGSALLDARDGRLHTDAVLFLSAPRHQKCHSGFMAALASLSYLHRFVHKRDRRW